MAEPPAKVYLGDGVYAVLEAGPAVVLTTENGIATTNTVYLEPEVWENLLEYMKAVGWSCHA